MYKYCADCSVYHLKFPKVIIIHVLVEVGTFCMVLLSVSFRICLHGSSLGPASYIVNAGDLCPQHAANHIIKFADGTYHFRHEFSYT